MNERAIDRRYFMKLGGGVVLLGPALLAACGGGDDDASLPSDGGGAADTGSSTGGSEASTEIDILTIHPPVIPTMYDPARVPSIGQGTIQLALEPLLWLGVDGELIPNLAESWEQVDDITYEYTIRDGVKFWDGSELTLDDVIFSIDLHRDPDEPSEMSSVWAGVDSITAAGDRTIRIVLTEPDFEFRYAAIQTPIISQTYAAEAGDDIGNPATLNMGTGPYRVVELVPSSSIRFERNEDYWGDVPAARQVVMTMIEDPSARLVALRAGDIDELIQVPLQLVESYRSADGIELQSTPDYSVYKLNFEMSTPPWDDIHLRRALSHSVDTNAIAAGVMRGEAVIAPTLIPPDRLAQLMSDEEIEALYAELSDVYPAFDLGAAAEELAQSTVPDGISTTVVVPASDPSLASIMQTIAQSAGEVGIDIEVQQVDEATYYTSVYFEHSTDGLSIDWFSANSPDVINMPRLTLHSALGHPQGSGINIANYSSPDVDEALDELAVSTDDARRKELVAQVLRAAAEDLPYMPLFFPNLLLARRTGYAYEGFDAFWWAMNPVGRTTRA